jgi:hypothetical protein
MTNTIPVIAETPRWAKQGSEKSHKERLVQCCEPGCTTMVVTTGSRPKLCEQHRIEREQASRSSANARFSAEVASRRLRPLDEIPGRKQMPSKGDHTQKCETCKLLKDCRTIVLGRLEDPFCFVSSKRYFVFERVVLKSMAETTQPVDAYAPATA